MILYQFILVDLQCPVKYDIVGDGLAPQLFAINEDTGLISLKVSLMEDTGLEYKVFLGNDYPFIS